MRLNYLFHRWNRRRVAHHSNEVSAKSSSPIPSPKTTEKNSRPEHRKLSKKTINRGPVLRLLAVGDGDMHSISKADIFMQQVMIANPKLQVTTDSFPHSIDGEENLVNVYKWQHSGLCIELYNMGDCPNANMLHQDVLELMGPHIDAILFLSNIHDAYATKKGSFDESTELLDSFIHHPALVHKPILLSLDHTPAKKERGNLGPLLLDKSDSPTSRVHRYYTRQIRSICRTYGTDRSRDILVYYPHKHETEENKNLEFLTDSMRFVLLTINLHLSCFVPTLNKHMFKDEFSRDRDYHDIDFKSRKEPIITTIAQ